MAKPDPDEFGTVPEVADHLRVHPRSVQRYIESGALKAFKLGAGQQGRVRIRWSDVERFLEQRAS